MFFRKEILGIVLYFMVVGNFATALNASDSTWHNSEQICLFSDLVLQRKIGNPLGVITARVDSIKGSDSNFAVSITWLLQEKLGSIDTEIDDFCKQTLSELLPQVNNLTVATSMWMTQQDAGNPRSLKTGFDTDIVLSVMRLLYYAKNGCKEQADSFLRANVIPAIKNSELAGYIPEGYQTVYGLYG